MSHKWEYTMSNRMLAFEIVLWAVISLVIGLCFKVFRSKEA